MESSTIFASAGLCLDIVGVSILWWKEVPWRPSGQTWDEGDIQKAEEGAESKRHIWTKSGLVALIAGFALQLISVWIK
ncbi:hypothetical protein Lepil_3202 [Leptonema illini DSM 21528]|uniref:Uncharacterized protein n=1 Tax=Leptonema illini DSM 21528 TaxID=929563 RepID=H2CG16_9LEPT|nr:hypothetical protein Lepil_3202 [Leptonema illini DSM 21528]